MAPDSVWDVLTEPRRFDEWVDAGFVSAVPPGRVVKGQRIELSAPAFGRRWPVTIDVLDVDAARRWLDLDVSLPFGVVNHEHVTLAPADKGTLVRLN